MPLLLSPVGRSENNGTDELAMTLNGLVIISLRPDMFFRCHEEKSTPVCFTSIVLSESSSWSIPILSAE